LLGLTEYFIGLSLEYPPGQARHRGSEKPDKRRKNHKPDQHDSHVASLGKFINKFGL
jgi:hypothetical protein